MKKLAAALLAFGLFTGAAFGQTVPNAGSPMVPNSAPGTGGGGGGTPANPTATAGPAAVNGSASTYMRSDAAPAVQLGTNAQKGVVQVDGTTISASAGIISAVNNGTVTQVNTACGTTGGPITATGTISATSGPLVFKTGANYPIVAADICTLLPLKNASNQIPTIPAAGTTGFEAGKFIEACNYGAGTQTITPASGTIGGASTYVLAAGSDAAPKCIGLNSDGTNYVLDLTGPNAVPPAGLFTTTGALKGNGSGAVSQAACADLSNAGTGCPANTGTSGATLPFLNGTNTWSGTQTFGAVVGTVTSQAGTTYTLAATDCGTLVRFTNASAVTVTIPQGLAVGCNIAIMQAAAGQVAVNGSAVTPATLQSAHSYTKTFGAGAIIGISTDASNHATLTGDGA